MLHYEVGNLLEAPQTVIAHQVNCQGVMNSGVAKAIRNKYPEVYTHYINYYHVIRILEGKAQFIETNDKKIVINLFGQKNYGYDGKCYTSYAYLTEALVEVFVTLKRQKINEFAIPYKMGCDRGGGNWEIVSSILEDLSEKYGIDVYIYSLNEYEKEN